MLRKTALVTAMLGAFASQAYALGLGDIDLRSALNQPLKAEIEVLGANPRELGELHVTLASQEAYARSGLERVHFHTKLKFEILTGKDGKGVVQVSSREPVREPFLDFLIEASWSNGQVIREYTVLVDPPVLMPAPAPATQAPTAQPAPSTSSAKTASPKPKTTPKRTYAAGPGEYASKRGDSLWKVAEKVRPDQGVTMEQTMLGLLEANPEAFVANNINNLKAGYVMRVPSRDEMTVISAAEADSEVSRQNRAWREGRATAPRPSPTATTTSRKTAAAPSPVATKPAPTAEPKLQLVAPEEDAGVIASQPGGSESGLADVRKDLNIAVEAVEAQKQQNQELTDRLSQLEQQIQQLHRMIQLKDQELASLQGAQIDTEESVLVEESLAQVDGAAPVGTQEDAVMDDVVTMDEEIILDDEPLVVEDDEAASPFDDVMNNPALLGGVAGLVLLIGILAWLIGRKRRMATTEFQESILAERAASSAVPAATIEPEPVVSVPTSQASEPVSAPADEAPTSHGPESDSSLFTDFAVSDMGSIQDDSEADPVAEADVYLAYGRFQQAEELIKSAVDKSPERHDLKVKLLEIYHAARNLASFEDVAQAYAAEVGTDDDNWSRIEEMAVELNSSHPLFGDSGKEPVTDPNAVSDEMGSMDFSGEVEAPALDEFPEAEVAEQGQPEEIEGLDFDLGGLEDLSKSETNDSAEELLESDLTEPVLESIADEPVIEPLDEGEGVLTQIDEVATKLDLARAYIEMGDPEGARSILDEVMEEGNSEQKAEAQELIGQLS